MTHQLASPLMVWRLKVSYSHFINKYFFRITASAWAARTWTTVEAVVERPAMWLIIIQLPALSLRRVRANKELLDRGSTWERGGSSQAQVWGQNCCRRPRLWTAMTKVRLGDKTWPFVDLHWWPKCFSQDWEVQGNHFLLSVKKWWRRPASASWLRRRRGRRRGRASSRSRRSSSRSSAAALYRSSTLPARRRKANRLRDPPWILQDWIYLLLFWWNVYSKYMFIAISCFQTQYLRQRLPISKVAWKH